MEYCAFAIINDGKTAVDARNNWWGSAISNDLAAATRDGMDRAGLGLVDNRDALKQPLPFVDLSEIP